MKAGDSCSACPSHRPVAGHFVKSRTFLGTEDPSSPGFDLSFQYRRYPRPSRSHGQAGAGSENGKLQEAAMPVLMVSCVAVLGTLCGGSLTLMMPETIRCGFSWLCKGALGLSSLHR
jgi:hypothetical protein